MKKVIQNLIFTSLPIFSSSLYLSPISKDKKGYTGKSLTFTLVSPCLLYFTVLVPCICSTLTRILYIFPEFLLVIISKYKYVSYVLPNLFCVLLSSLNNIYWRHFHIMWRASTLLSFNNS